MTAPSTPGSPDAPDAPGWPAEFAARYRAAGYWTGATLGGILDERARVRPDAPAVVDGDRRIGYGELAERVSRVAGGFAALGIGAGDHVVVQLPNVAEFLETVFALFRIGALPVFALPSHRASEIGYFCEFTDAAAYVIPDVHEGFDHRRLAEGLPARVGGARHVIVAGDPGPYLPFDGLRVAEPYVGPRPAPDDLAFLQLSGGSTGVPKLIPRTHDDYLYSVRASAEICELGERSVYLVALPAAHNFPLSSPGTLGVLYAGGTVVLAPGPSPEVAFPLIEREGVTITALVPPLALVWLDAAARTAHDLSTLDVLQVGGAKFSAEAARRVRPELGATLQQVFGMAEGLVNYTRLNDPDELVVHTQGRPISPDDEIRIVGPDGAEVAPGETGDLLTRGPYTIRGYYRAPEHNAIAFTEDGFYRTGDVVRRTPEGYLVVEGRAKDQINRGGEKVAAEEVENHLLAHDWVHDVAVVSMPDDYLGERTCAFVVPSASMPSGRRLKLGTVKAFLRERGLADYKLPDRVEVIDRFPETGVGKVSKKELRVVITRTLAQRSAQRKEN
ncbi:(2,3-dihydroxybenzoyl)adenylate synthase [Amycolatopsis antarctica]|uniref:(2,3-dihydroxybenzoyl)adenylate synthase n=1 Tax=Amycolatopsis antarctica TaxID=1854586 RepID=A0A263CZ72_9PSEU|nr:(2,3-dihydroxybenzoyl)adenylate synthase [Amycolatopsis antarctica]OZM70606.1 (2,3-dihydroxybenzoyl)adenylate synthase [Amycolatopsis antarctica]